MKCVSFSNIYYKSCSIIVDAKIEVVEMSSKAMYILSIKFIFATLDSVYRTKFSLYNDNILKSDLNRSVTYSHILGQNHSFRLNSLVIRMRLFL